ncbi:MAG: hypothetical protein IPM60_11040 [Rhodospirillales bacterium]|nr:hypothetical protein [Rhodospirillales bacterium]
MAIETPRADERLRHEAENVARARYSIVDEPSASNGKIVSTYSDGIGVYDFRGESGAYDIYLRYLDEDDGQGFGTISINGNQIVRWEFDQDDGGWHILHVPVDLTFLDQIRVTTARDQSEYGRWDFFDVLPEGSPPTTSAAPPSTGGGTPPDGGGTPPGGGGTPPDGGGTPPDGGDLPGLASGRLEAEDMKLTGFSVNPASVASGGAWIWTFNKGTAQFEFTGASGDYDLAVGYLDEDDGAGSGSIIVDGVQVDSWAFDQQNNFNERVVSVSLQTGDVVQLKTTQNAGEYGRLDYAELRAAGSTPPDGGGTPPDGGGTPPDGGDLPGLASGRLEAEDMDLNGFSVNPASVASGGAWIRTFNKGTAQFEFTGASGDYDLAVGYLDEHDGVGSGSIIVDGEQVDTWSFNQPDGIYERVVSVSLQTGDIVQLKTTQNAGEYGRLDYAELRASGSTPPDGGSTPPDGGGTPPDGGGTPTGEVVRYEAENMQLSRYVVEDQNWASGGKVVKTFNTGKAKFDFSGVAGTYKLTAAYGDEDDGQGTGSISVDGVEVGSWNFDQDDGPNTFVVTASVNHNSVIEISTTRDYGEYGRFDYLEMSAIA